MFNITEMTHYLSHYPYEELYSLATTEGALSENKHNPSRVELVTAIVANRAIKFVTNGEEILQKDSNSRSKYRLEDGCGDSYFLELTKEQVDFFSWCFNHEIDIRDSSLIKMDNNIIWEKP